MLGLCRKQLPDTSRATNTDHNQIGLLVYTVWPRRRMKNLFTFCLLSLVTAQISATASVTGLTENLLQAKAGTYEVAVAGAPYATTKTVTMEIYIPKSMNTQKNRPVVIFYHGNTTDKTFYRKGSGFMKRKAEAHRFILISPQQWWSLSGGNTSGANDSRLATNAVLNRLKASGTIDQGRVYATGFSAGGFAAFLTVLDSLDHKTEAAFLEAMGGAELNVFAYKGFASFKGNFYDGVMQMPPQVEDAKSHFPGLYAGKVAYVSVGGKRDAARVQQQAPEMRDFLEGYLGIKCSYFSYPNEGHVMSEKNWQDFASLADFH